MFKNVGVELGNVDPEHQFVHQNQDHALVLINVGSSMVMAKV